MDEEQKEKAIRNLESDLGRTLTRVERTAFLAGWCARMESEIAHLKAVLEQARRDLG